MKDHPLTLRESSTAVHEWFLSLRGAGFGRWEALFLMGVILRGDGREDTGDVR